MSNFSAREGYIGIAKQASKGTGVAPATFFKWDGETDMSAKQAFTLYREGGDSVNPGVTLKERHDPSGSFAGLLRPSGGGLLLALMAGADSVAGIGPYTHTITPAAAGSMPWASIERSIADQLQNRFVDCRIKTLTIEGEQGMPLRFTCEYVGISEDASVTAATDTYETDDPWLYFDAVFTKDGSASTMIRRFRITFQNVWSEDLFTNSITRRDLVLLSRHVEFEFELLFETGDPYKATYLGGSTTAAESMDTGSFKVVADNGAAGTSNRKLTLDLKNVVYTAGPVEINNTDDLAAYRFTGHAKKGAADNLFDIEVINGDSAAYV